MGILSFFKRRSIPGKWGYLGTWDGRWNFSKSISRDASDTVIHPTLQTPTDWKDSLSAEKQPRSFTVPQLPELLAKETPELMQKLYVHLSGLCGKAAPQNFQGTELDDIAPKLVMLNAARIRMLESGKISRSVSDRMHTNIQAWSTQLGLNVVDAKPIEQISVAPVVQDNGFIARARQAFSGLFLGPRSAAPVPQRARSNKAGAQLGF